MSRLSDVRGVQRRMNANLERIAASLEKLAKA